MQSRRARLDRFLSASAAIKRRDVLPLLAQGRVRVDGVVCFERDRLVDQFAVIELDHQVLQRNAAAYVMLNKPAGVVSATQDVKHTTVVQLLDRADRHSLHIVGRLDFNSTGLLLLTNDGRWSRYLSKPENKVAKTYRVTLAKPVSADCVEAFAEGMYFAYEGITTRPAQLHRLTATVALVELMEGRYHQIKRMFGRFDNEVLALHRLAVGNLYLDPALAPGASRELSATELQTLSLAADP